MKFKKIEPPTKYDDFTADIAPKISKDRRLSQSLLYSDSNPQWNIFFKYYICRGLLNWKFWVTVFI